MWAGGSVSYQGPDRYYYVEDSTGSEGVSDSIRIEVLTWEILDQVDYATVALNAISLAATGGGSRTH